MSFERDFSGPNLGYILELYERYQSNPDSVAEDARRLFSQWKPADLKAGIPSGVDFQKLIGVADLAQAIRTYGYLAARLDPLGNPPRDDPALSPEFYNIQEDDLLQLSSDAVNLLGHSETRNASEAINVLRSIYCGASGYDYGHIRIPEERTWLQEAAEGGRFRSPNKSIDKKGLLERLNQIEALEIFLSRIYPGKTRFSVEGLDMLIPMLDEFIEVASEDKIQAVLIGMAHRGRLNVLAHILQKPYEQILAEFKDPKGRSSTWDELGWTGDVKYHMGGYKMHSAGDAMDIVVRMPANPSHLELINPVIQGMARAANSKVDMPGAPEYFDNNSLPITIHGDASFAGQGIVSETLNLSQLPGYSTGGSLHIIANNQLGFTATGGESRSSLYASDLAKGFEIPVIHVNADDPQACIEAVCTAFAYRQKFHKDFVIDLIGYRRYGHNEGDEPRFTQPLMYHQIDGHPSVRKIWASKLEEEGMITAGESEKSLQAYLDKLQEVNQKLDAERSLKEPIPKAPPAGAAQKVDTSVSLERLQELNQALRKFPADFHPNPKLIKAVEKHQKILNDPDANNIDWAAAEELAFASILEDDIAIRMTGQDTVRGTFSQRHAVFYDVDTNQTYTPLQSIPQAKASFEIHNTPVSEIGPVGFEAGYNIQAPDRLVLWEAQYGDFVNNIQTMVDEVLLSGRAKWGLTPSLVLLLPHGNEGMGPDHSSARIERFLGLAAEGNMRVAIPTTAAQYFHLLRRQALLLKTDPLPLIVFTPKGFLRHPLAVSTPEELAKGNWQPLLTEKQSQASKKKIKQLILCSGRIYFDLVSHELHAESKDTTIVKVEQLYPFPQQAMEKLLVDYPAIDQVIWAQEEPRNMGAWDYIHPYLKQTLGDQLPLYYVGRPESSSPAEGSSTLYRINQQTLIRRAYKIEEQIQNQSVIVERG
ncbi:2-oxoglutarate dehydrogenase E1 component [Chloroflexota bacterium]